MLGFVAVDSLDDDVDLRPVEDCTHGSTIEEITVLRDSHMISPPIHVGPTERSKAWVLSSSYLLVHETGRLATMTSVVHHS